MVLIKLYSKTFYNISLPRKLRTYESQFTACLTDVCTGLIPGVVERTIMDKKGFQKFVATNAVQNIIKGATKFVAMRPVETKRAKPGPEIYRSKVRYKISI